MHYLAILALAAAVSELVWLAARSADAAQGHVSLSLFYLRMCPPESRNRMALAQFATLAGTGPP